MSERQSTACRTEPESSGTRSPAVLQRACACGGSAGLDDQCEACRQEQLTGQAARLQSKPRIGPADDHYERQADRVADTVMLMPATGALGFSIERITPLVQRQPIEEEEEEEIQTSSLQGQTLEEEEEDMLMKRVPGGSGPARARLTGTHGRGGEPLPATERAFFEPRLGFDFSSVRIHTGSAAAASARAVGAKAYTVGRRVVFGAGQWAPGTADGRRLIAHELTHVVQQSRSGIPPTRVQRQPRGCTHAVTGVADRARRPAREIAISHRLAADWASTALNQLEALLRGDRTPMFVRPSLNFHFSRPGRRRIQLIRNVYRLIVRRLNRGTRIYHCNTERSDPCLRCGGRAEPGGIIACSFCPSTTDFTRICPVFFTTDETERAITLVHEAAHAAGACGDAPPWRPGYPGRNPANNAFSYEGFARTVGRTLGAAVPLRRHVPRAPTLRSAGGGASP
jgi:hypothetical protein